MSTDPLPKKASGNSRRIFWIAPLSLVVMWGLLYLPHLRTSPSWYGDETGTFLLGRNLFQGQPAIGSLWLTYWHTYYPIQPGYLWVAGLFSTVTGGDILGARFLNTLIALSIALLIYFQGRRITGIPAAWFGAGIFLSFSQSVIHFRWVYPHNAVALGFAIALLFLLRRNRRRADWTAGFGLALATVSHPLFVHGAVAAVLCRLKRPASWPRLAIPPLVAISTTFLLMTWVYWPKHWLFEDLLTLAGYYGKSSSTAGGNSNLFINFFIFYTQNTFHIASLACLLICCQKKLYPIAIFGFTVSCLLLQNRQNLPVFYYQAMVLAPIFGIAWAGALSFAVRKLRRLSEENRLDRICALAALSLPVIFTIAQLPAVFQGRLIPKNQPWVTQDVREVEAAANWINARTSPNDLVVANVNIAWLLKARTMDYFQAILWDGMTTEYFPDSIKRERFRYPSDLKGVKFFVVGDIDQRWTFLQPNMDKLANRLSDEKWTIVWQGPNYLVLRNPAFPEDTETSGKSPSP